MNLTELNCFQHGFGVKCIFLFYDSLEIGKLLKIEMLG